MSELNVRCFSSLGLKDPALLDFLNMFNQWAEKYPLSFTQLQGQAQDWQIRSQKQLAQAELWILANHKEIPSDFCKSDSTAILVLQSEALDSLNALERFQAGVDAYVNPKISLEHWNLMAVDAMKKLLS